MSTEKSPKTVPVIVRLPRHLLSQFRSFSWIRRQTMSALIRTQIKETLTKESSNADIGNGNGNNGCKDAGSLMDLI